MRRVLAVLVGLSLVVGALAASTADAKKRKKKSKRPRKVEMPYSEPALGTAGLGVCFQGSSCVFVEPQPRERFVHVEIKDELGLPVNGSIIQDTNGDGSYLAADDQTTHICGKTIEPLKIKPTTVTVWVWQGPGVMPPCAGAASSGVVELKFSNVT